MLLQRQAVGKTFLSGRPLGAAPTLVLRLVGPLRLFGPAGEDLTPTSTKAQGLLALLGTAPDLSRARAWVQDKLWSDSSGEQGAASLRQTMLRLRRTMGPAQDCLISERGWLRLLPERVRIAVDPEAHDWTHSDELPELCEGLDINDAEFEDWIRDQRLAFTDRAEEAREKALLMRRRQVEVAGTAPVSLRPVLLLAPCDANTDVMRTLGEILTGDIAALVANIGGAEILHDAALDSGLPRLRALRLRIRAFDEGGIAVVRAQIENPERHSLLRSVGRTFPKLLTSTSDSLEPLQLFAAEIANMVCFELGRGQVDGSDQGAAAALGYRALEFATTFTPDSLREADRLFATAYQGFSAPVYLAWRAHIRLASIIERFAADPVETLREADELTRRALDGDPFNSVVMAHASDVEAITGTHPDHALALARAAIEADPANAFARASMAYRLAWTDDTEGAHVEAVRALKLAARQPHQVLWTMRCCLTAARCGRYDEAVRYGFEAHRLEPDFKPPLRYLAALLYHRGDEAGAVRVLQKLQGLEPDFTLELFRQDNYPVATLRGTPLMRVADSGLL